MPSVREYLVCFQEKALANSPGHSICRGSLACRNHFNDLFRHIKCVHETRKYTVDSLRVGDGVCFAQEIPASFDFSWAFPGFIEKHHFLEDEMGVGLSFPCRSAEFA